MATQAEIAVLKGTATQVKNESQVGGNTAGRVGGLFEGIVDALPSDEVIDGKITQAVADIQPIVIEGNVDNAPDQEDLTSVNQGGTDVLKFKDKTYSPALFSGLGRVYLRKNVVTPENLGYAINLLTAEMVSQTNTIYRIQYDYNLNGQTITLPANVTLQFDGGSLANGTIVGNHTKVLSENVCFKNSLILGGTWNTEVVFSKWFSFISTDDGVTDNVDVFKQLQSFVNGTEGCKLEMQKGYYQTSVKWNTPDEIYEGVPKWRTNVYVRDEMVVLNIIDLPYFELNMNKATIKIIDNPTPFYYVISFVNIKNGSIHDGTIIGCARGYSYAEYYNYNNVLTQNYEMITGLYQAGGFLDAYNFKITEIQGDGVALGSSPWKYEGDDTSTGLASDGYALHNCEISYCGRNGVTLHSSEMGNLSNVHIHHIGSDADDHEIGTDGIMGFNPRSGIDVEFEDGQGLKPIMVWDSLKFNNCNRKCFGFAAAAQSEMEEFHASNLYLDGDCATNNLTAKIRTFTSCYIKQSSEWSSFVGSETIFTDCKIDVVSSFFDSACTFVRCVFNDLKENSGDLNVTGTGKGTFYDCVFNLKNRIYLRSKTFVGCTFNIDGVVSVVCDNSLFDNCKFYDVTQTQGTYTYRLTGTAASWIITIKNCYFYRALGTGSSTSQYFIYTEDSNKKAYIENTTFEGGCNICHRQGTLTIRKCSASSRFYLFCYQINSDKTAIIEGCNIENLFVSNSAAYKPYVCNSVVKVEGKLQGVLVDNSVVNMMKTTADSESNNTNGVFNNSILDFASDKVNNSAIILNKCLVKGGITEANFLGTAKGCTFETPLPTSGTTAQRPSASVAGIGFKYFDTTLTKPVWSDGTQWVDATGAAV